MGSALVFPLSENGVSLKIVGTPYDREIIDECIRTGRNPKLSRPFPAGITFYQFEDWKRRSPDLTSSSEAYPRTVPSGSSRRF